MKISIFGYSGSGKSTLARIIGEARHIAVLHMDTVHWLPGWQTRSTEEKRKITEEFLDNYDSWVIEGNYSKLFFERRTEESDEIILMLFNRFSCLKRVIARYKKYKGRTRPDMTVGCDEKVDWKFIKWVLWEGRSKEAVDRYRRLISKYGDKVTVIRNQRQLNAYINKIQQSAPN